MIREPEVNPSLSFPRLDPAGGADHRAPGGAIDELARIVTNCTAPKSTVAELRSSLQTAHEEIQSLLLRVRSLEEKQEADRAGHAVRLRTLEGRCLK